MSYLQALPMVDNPEVFGMHDNANIYTYIHTHMYIYIHTYIHTYIRTYINTADELPPSTAYGRQP